MKNILIIGLLLPLNVFAIEHLKLDIDRLILNGPQGNLTAKEIVVGEGEDRIGYRNAGELLYGDLFLKESGLEFKASNGMFITSTNAMGVNTLKEMIVENGKLEVEPEYTSFQAGYLSATNAKAKGEATGVSVRCEKNKQCVARADKLLVDNQTMLKRVDFQCSDLNCSKNFRFHVDELDEGKRIKLYSLSTPRGIIEIKDLRSLTLKRVEQRLTLDGNVKVLFGSIGFDAAADIVKLNDDVLELKLKSVKLSDTISVRDFTMYLIRELLSSKSVAVNGDNILIKLR